MYCKICGATLAPGEVFCKNCGASNTNMNVEPVAPTVEPMSQGQTVPDAGPVPPTPVVPGPMPPNAMTPPTPFPEPINAEQPKEEVDNQEENTKEASEKKDNGKFLVIIGVVVGLLATAVIGYLIYSALRNKNMNNGGGADVTFVTQSNYSVAFANHTFVLRTDINSLITSKLELTTEKWNAKIWSTGTPNFEKITNDNLKKTFEAITDYKVGNISSKTYSNLNCFEINVDYPDGAKTLLLLCDRAAGGYWAIEVGTKSYTDYPTSDIANEVVTLVANAKKIENGTDSKLRVGEFVINVEEVSTTTPSE